LRFTFYCIIVIYFSYHKSSFWQVAVRTFELWQPREDKSIWPFRKMTLPNYINLQIANSSHATEFQCMEKHFSTTTHGQLGFDYALLFHQHTNNEVLEQIIRADIYSGLILTGTRTYSARVSHDALADSMVWNAYRDTNKCDALETKPQRETDTWNMHVKFQWKNEC